MAFPFAGAPKLTQDQIDLAQRLYDAGEHTVAQIASILEVPSTTVCYRVRAGKRVPVRGKAFGTSRSALGLRDDRLTQLKR